jgi:hypothetical protein
MPGFLHGLVDVNKDEVSGPKLIELVPLIGVHFIIATFSVQFRYRENWDFASCGLTKPRISELKLAIAGLRANRPNHPSWF